MDSALKPLKSQANAASARTVRQSSVPETNRKSRIRVEREPRVRLETDKRRAQLIELGLERFGKSSFDEVSIEDIAQAAGISKGLIYHYFPTKRAFYVACVRAEAERFLAFVDRHTEGTPADQLRARIDMYLTFVGQRGHAFTTLMRSGIGVDMEIARIVDETRQACLDVMMHGFDALPAAIWGASADQTQTPFDDPLVRLALRGFIGFAEAVSIEWVEARAHDPDDAGIPPQEDVRELLVNALVASVTSAFAMKKR